MIDEVLGRIHIVTSHVILIEFDMVQCIASNLDYMSYKQQLYENTENDIYMCHFPQEQYPLERSI